MNIKILHTLYFLPLLLFPLFIQAQNTTYTYDQLISEYSDLARAHSDVHLFNMGSSDYGKPIYLCVIGVAADSQMVFSYAKNSTVFLINTAIHAGEPCGVNASLDFVKQYVQLSENEKMNYPVMAFIPAYNVGGMHNRNSYSRANQVGPDEYGFRGNARNFDLNRDFVKMDSKNMQRFARIFNALDPDVFLDTHTSNGADYQYTLTLISSLKARLNPVQASLVYDEMLPTLKDSLWAKDSLYLFPYIEMNGQRLHEGIHAFNDKGRYSMGYARLFHALSFTSETHMLKPFHARVEATYKLINEMAKYTRKFDDEIERVKSITRNEMLQSRYHRFNYISDTTLNNDSYIDLKGYAYKDSLSLVTNSPRLYYDRSKDTTFNIPYDFYFKAKDSLLIPEYYVVRSWETEVIQRLLMNNVSVQFLDKDTNLLVRQNKVLNYETVNTPYEGHYLHYNTKVQEAIENIKLHKGDALVYTHQVSRLFIVETLEPKCADSYFNWGFFDSYLQQKEHFSPYVFEDIAMELLANDDDLKREFEVKKEQDADFSANRWAQLNFIYMNSPFYERSHKVLPVYKSLR
ncbi:Zinc carboxypeptidase [Lishizhenia tianjinensis]|uniref:Zinc carboxypeptidase n=1 Tax=Lishizhenia tianjinensis TaxID=477690 RepID=A0A1I6YDU6_9FLAO|nr:M14 family zinc carboxypeptidase [Lishizhenia tianjinensis]SFT48578.1 Zinc carboxypeptidase [Lishizhenia tianjinensis]